MPARILAPFAAFLLVPSLAGAQAATDNTKKPDPTPLKLLEGGDGNRVSFPSVNTANLAVTLTIENNEAKPLTGVEIDLSRFTAPSASSWMRW